MEKKQKKRPGLSILLWLLVVAVSALANSRRTQVFFRYTLPRYLPRYLPILIGILCAVFLLWLVVKIKGSKKEHTHDRIDTVSYDVNETEFEHYKKQLDGFLKAGIIEKEEYRLLLRRFRERG